MSHRRQKKEFLKNGLSESSGGNLVREKDFNQPNKNLNIPSEKTLDEFSKFLQELKKFPPFIEKPFRL